MYKDTVTLFNHYQNRTVDIWYPSILKNVNLNMDKSVIIAKTGANSSDNAILSIRYHTVNEKKMINNKIWLPPKKWIKQPEDLLAHSLTFAIGNTSDFFMLGEWENENLILDSDYQNGFYNHLNKTCDYIFMITAVTFYSTIPHFEIIAK